MNPVVVRLALTGSRRSWGRLVGIVAGVAVGVTLFLLLFGASGAFQARDLRSGWTTPAGEDGANLKDSTVLVSDVQDRFRGVIIDRLDVAATPDSTVAIPGIPQAPAVGEFYASPALVDLIASVPEDQLGARFGTLVGVLPDSVLKSPDSLVAIAGHSAATLESRYSTRTVADFSVGLFSGNSNYETVAIVGAIALLFPVLLFVGIVAGLGAAERRERFSTLRLIGASPRTVIAITASETAATSLIGALLGVLLAYVFRPLVASLSIDGGTFFVDDLGVSTAVIVLTVALTVVASTAVAAHRVSRAGIGPLGVTRQQHENAPSPWRLVPLAVGTLAMVGTTLVARYTELLSRIDLPLIGSFILMSVGLLVAGPYLTVIASRALARRAKSAESVIATNRILRAPAATFRSVSGLVIAVFMVSVFAGAATTAAESATVADASGLLPNGTVVASEGLFSDERFDRAGLERIEGVTAVGELYFNESVKVLSTRDAAAIGFTDLPATPFADYGANLRANDLDSRTVTASTITSTDGLQLYAVFAVTDGSSAAIERARTWLETSQRFDTGIVAPGTRNDPVDIYLQTLIGSFATLAYLGVGIATLIAGVSLAVATVSAALDRRRVLGLTRLIGMPVAGIRRIVAFEAAVPLLAVVALSAVLGLIAAWMLLVGLTDGRRTLGWPEPTYYVALGASLLLALGAVAASFGTIRRNTAVASTRFE